nr:phosphatidylinositol 3,4,5-trisphosphate 3-phosphatase TPTE2-like isoform X2 [Camelus dromedarius]
MKRLKDNLCGWFMPQKNKVMDAPSGSSDNNDNVRSDPNELTSGIHHGVTHESTSLNNLTSVSSEGFTSEHTALTELTTGIADRTSTESTSLNNLTSVSSEGFTSEHGDLSELKEVVCVKDTNESGVEQLSSLDDGDVEEQLSNLNNGDEDTKCLNLCCLVIKGIAYIIVSSFAFRVTGILLVFVDMCTIIMDLFLTKSTIYIPMEYHFVSLAIAAYFFLDVSLRVFVEGVLPYFSNVFNSLDATIVVVTLLLEIVYNAFGFTALKDVPKLTVFTRPLRLFVLLRAVHLAHQERHLEALTRRMVSENKRRYRKDGFDLDLTYVTERIIAMSFPSSGGQSFYRNPIKEVMRFLDTKHANHYQVYNLCSEKAYDPEYFHHRVRQYMIDDHNVPSLIEMLAFSRDVEKWMAQDEENIIVVHCKGGKGRTGTMICAYLLASERFTTAEDSLYYFGERRTDKSTSNKYQGVETPSQSRFVGYFAKVKNTYNLHLPPRKILKINKFVIYSIHGVGKGDGSDLEVQIMMKRKTVFFCSASRYCKIVHDAESNRVIINIFNSPLLYDEVKVRFLSSALPRYYDNCPFYFWFHTSFIQDNRLYLSRNELDNPHKPKTWKIYRSDFAVEVYFDEVKL